MKTPKIAILTPYLTPYRINLFNYIYNQKNCIFKVFCLTEMGENRNWKIDNEIIYFDFELMHGLYKYFGNKELSIYFNHEIIKILYDYKPDVIIASGYDAIAYWLAFFYCRIFNKNFILWNGSTLLSTTQTKGLIGRIKRILIKNTDNFIAYGTKAKEYLEYFGADKDKILISINTVDMDFYKKKVEEYRENSTFLENRDAYPKFLLLYVGQLIERKGIIKVLEALNKLHDPQIGFFIVGDGPLKYKLMKYCNDTNLQNIFFEGYKNEDELCRYYALSDVLIIPSLREVWGLVVNEALASGSFVLVSKYAGSGFDLIKEGWNGSIFDPYNVEEIANIIQYVKNNAISIKSRREKISMYACEQFSIIKAGDSFLRSIKQIEETI
ncbi:MAG: glycosyltransferase family 4 protein [Desulfobacteraceae bacterium]|nr:glycosyltransferase family 4 protein [Desulfobacteraceae bacterium]